MDLDALIEAERRGILPDDRKALLTEARQRGLIPGGDGEKTSTAEALVRGVIQGLTFNTGDEIYGAARGAYDSLTGGSFGEGYSKGAGEARQANKKAARDNPYAYYGGEIGSAMLVPGGLAKIGIKGTAALASRSMGARMAGGAAEGLAYGALYGAGNAEGSTENRLKAAAETGLTGAALGTAAPPLFSAASSLLRYPANAVRASLTPKAVSGEKLGEAILRDRAGTGTAGASSLKALDRKLLLSNHAMTDLKHAMDVAGVEGRSPLMLADLLGENTKNLLRSATNMGGASAETLAKKLERRQYYQAERVERAVRQAMAIPRNSRDMIEDLIAGAKKKAGPDFKAAFSGGKLNITPELDEILKRPGFVRLQEKLTETLQNEGKSLKNVGPVESIHRMKMQLDREISSLKRGVQDSKANWDVRTLLTMKNDLVGEVVKQVPAYRKALDSYSGSMALKNAAEDGYQSVFSSSIKSDDIARAMAGLSKSEKATFQAGMTQAIVDKTMSQGRNRDRVKSIFGTPEVQKILELAIPRTKLRRQFQTRMLLEGRMTGTKAAVQGNSTTAKQLTQLSEAGRPAEAVGAVAAAATGRIGSALNFLSNQAARLNGLTPKTADSIIRLAMENNGQQAMKAFADAVQRESARPEKQAAMLRKFLAAQGSGNAAASESY
jgi:hypothetical protein